MVFFFFFFQNRAEPFCSECDPYLQGLVRVRHRQDFVSRVDPSQLAEGTQQPLTGPAVELQLLLVVFWTRQNLRARIKHRI